MADSFLSGELLTSAKLNLAAGIGGSKSGIARTAAQTDATTTETLINSRTLTAVNGRTYIPQLTTNILIAGGTAPAGCTIRFRWAVGGSVANTDNLIQQINDFISTGTFQHYRQYQASLDYASTTQTITVGVFALCIAPMTLLRFVGAANAVRDFRVIDDGPTTP